MLAIARELWYTVEERLVILMANTSAVYARIDTDLKDNA